MMISKSSALVKVRELTLNIPPIQEFIEQFVHAFDHLVGLLRERNVFEVPKGFPSSDLILKK